jgi:hypothetical protein
MAVSVLHFIFECLAFKNEIAFWKNKSDLQGLSVRTFFVELFCSVHFRSGHTFASGGDLLVSP